MNTIQINLFAIVLFMVAMFNPLLCRTQVQPTGITRANLMHSDISVTGFEVIQSRVDIMPGVVFNMHSHPGEELVYVIEGELEYTLEGDYPVVLKAGDVLFIPFGKPHMVKNVGNENAAELATYIVQKGKPLIVLSK